MRDPLRDNLEVNPSANQLALLDEAASRLENAAPEETLRWAFGEFGDSVTLATGFGPGGVALIDMSVKLNPNVDIFFLDTSFLFPETYDLRRRLEDRYKVSIRAQQARLTPHQQDETFGPKLWSTDPDLCCRLRKLEPLREALRHRRAWITAIRREQTIERSNARVVEWDYRWGLVKISPLARWSRNEVWEYLFRHNVPYNPLHDRGYPSIGCAHCTTAVNDADGERAGRWPGKQKRECGIHLRPGVHSGEAQGVRAQLAPGANSRVGLEGV
jgi:phosphoadenosine phosphosulfate reductase